MFVWPRIHQCCINPSEGPDHIEKKSEETSRSYDEYDWRKTNILVVHWSLSVIITPRLKNDNEHALIRIWWTKMWTKLWDKTIRIQFESDNCDSVAKQSRTHLCVLFFVFFFNLIFINLFITVVLNFSSIQSENSKFNSNLTFFWKLFQKFVLFSSAMSESKAGQLIDIDNDTLNPGDTINVLHFLNNDWFVNYSLFLRNSILRCLIACCLIYCFLSQEKCSRPRNWY